MVIDSTRAGARRAGDGVCDQIGSDTCCPFADSTDEWSDIRVASVRTLSLALLGCPCVRERGRGLIALSCVDPRAGPVL